MSEAAGEPLSPRRTVDQVDAAGKTVFVRADFNVPTDDHGAITDDRRIRGALPTLRALLERGAAVVVASHFGRPAGTGYEAAESLAPVHRRLAELLDGTATVHFAGQVPTDAASQAAVAALRPGEVLLLENLRFEKGEKKGDPAFADRLAGYGQVYVNDAFGASHRAHASIVGPPRTLPSAAGRLVAAEVDVLLGLRDQPGRPFVAITGGSKVSDKLGVLEALLDVADRVLVGGGMCFTFFSALGHSVGSSLCEPDQVPACAELLDRHGDRLLLPSDVVALGPGGAIGDPAAGGEVRTVGRDVPEGWMGLDIGPGSAAEFGDAILEARTVLWNGPMGVFEDPRFAAGTRAVAEAVAECRGTTVIGGGDSAAAVAQFGLADRIDHISTGGGASLELIEQGDLPGLDALRNAPNARD
jgi:phosphoglycerate kinase